MKYLSAVLLSMLVGLATSLWGPDVGAQSPPVVTARVFVDGAAAQPGSVVQVFVGDVLCAEGRTAAPEKPPRLGSAFTLPLMTSADREACTRPDSILAFRVDGRAANEAVALGDVDADQPLLISVGPPVAAFFGRVDIPSIAPDSRILVSSERLVRCLVSEPLTGSLRYEIAVPRSGGCQESLFPESQGLAFSEGDQLIFWLTSADGSGVQPLNVLGSADSRWTAGFHSVDLGRVPCPDPCLPPPGAGPLDIGLPQTGDGPAAGPSVSLWWTLPVGASLIAAVGVGLLLSRRRLSI